MERESFEDNEVAALLNQYFISIKVDREERPDIDHLYMEFCQALTGSGGWPLTIIMTPDKKPFFTGTYFPKTRRYGRQGLMEILEQIGTLWETNEQKLRQSADEILEAIHNQQSDDLSEFERGINKYLGANNGEDIKAWGTKLVEGAYERLAQSFDSRFGGFGRAPKFPTPHTLGFLLRYGLDRSNNDACKIVQKTLDGMSNGGIYDHIGFGFSRYSTDEMWLVPHFEKMLYDNALLTIAYLENYQLQHNPRDVEKAEEILEYVQRDMTSPAGGFYSAEDADSEGEEGKFYVWTPEEVIQVLGEETGNLFCKAYDITTEGNFEEKNIPNLLKGNWERLCSEKNITLEQLKQILNQARLQLFEHREKRIHPYKDDKVLTSWNGLMIAAFSRAYQVTKKQEYLRSAEKVVSFIFNNLFVNGRLLARFREGEAAHLGYLDDYAFMIWGLLELYTASGKPKYLEQALDLQEKQQKLFSDDANGGYFLTGSDAEELLIRPKELYDGAVPSGNSITALNLLRLARLTGDQKWENLAFKQLLAFQSKLSSYPAGYTAFLQAIQFAMQPSQELILSGNLESHTMDSMKDIYFEDFRPYATILYQEGTITSLIPWLSDYPLNPDKTIAYLCENFSCQKPVESADDLNRLLN